MKEITIQKFKLTENTSAKKSMQLKIISLRCKKQVKNKTKVKTIKKLIILDNAPS